VNGIVELIASGGWQFSDKLNTLTPLCFDTIVSSSGMVLDWRYSVEN
jgi:hypothetical protein